MNERLVNLTDRPTRAELRTARRLLKPLADCGIAQAAVELLAVDSLIRDLYPRQARENGEDVPGAHRKRSHRRKRLIEPGDCSYACPTCNGRGHARRRQSVTCPQCAGLGVLLGTGEWTESYVAGGYAFKHRGVPAEQFVFSVLPRRGRACHRRGYLGGHLIGPPGRAEESAEQRRWARQYGVLGSGCFPSDVSATLEGRAKRRLRLGLVELPRNQRRMGSGRDRRNLKPSQERRVKMIRRVRRYQAEHNRAVRVESGFYRRIRGYQANIAMLRNLGIDVPALEERQPESVQYDSPIIAEGRRRGDLPPYDLDPTVPHDRG